MFTRRTSLPPLAAALVLLILPAFAGDGQTTVYAPEPRETMAELLDGLAAAFGVSLDADGFETPANRERVQQALKKLAGGSQELQTHGEELGKSTEGLRTALAREAAQALGDFEADRIDVAERRLQQVVSHCFSCHSRLPESQESPLGKRFAEAAALDELTLRERVFFLTATRQFNEALTAIEAALRTPERLGRTQWLFESYLKLALRVHGSPARACEELERFLEQTDPPAYLTARIGSWVVDLSDLRAEGELPLTLATARELIEEGRVRNDFPADKRGLVPFVTASGLLLRYLDTGERSAAEQAEAYYLLGIAESHISTTLWGDQTSFFLEKAIRLRPHSALSQEAYDFLQEYEVVRNSGASSVFIPDSVQAHLDELRVLAAPNP
jgi:hypothetical protein